MNNNRLSNGDDQASELILSHEPHPDGIAVDGLRIWPAIILLMIMAALRSLLFFIDSPNLTIRLLAFAGPALVSILLVGWFLFASRTPARQKLIISAGYALIVVATCATLHPSMRGVMIAVIIFPVGTVAWVLGLFATRKLHRLRIPISLGTAAVTFIAFNLIQSDGFDGRLNGSFYLRWQSTPEDRFMDAMASRRSSPSQDNLNESDWVQPDWPGFRGSDRTSTIAKANIAQDWDTIKPQEIWRTKVGPAWSSFAVAGNRLFTQEQRGNDEAVICLDVNSGELIWEYTYPGRFWEAIGGTGPRATPTIHDSSLLTLGAQGKLVRLDAKTGALIWQRDQRVDAGREPPTWGFSSSPLVVGANVVVFAGGENGMGVLAYRLEDGELVWSADSGRHSYSSAQLAVLSGENGILMLSELGLQFLSEHDGSEQWRYDWREEDYRVVQPLVRGDSILIGASLGTGAKRITVQKTGANWTVKEDWKTQSLKPDFNDTVFHNGFLYGFDSGIFCCIEFQTGKRKWKRGRYGNGQVLLLADRDQLLVTSETGEVILIAATPEEHREFAKFQALEGKTWNHPVLIGSRLFIRNSEEAACFDLPTQPKL